MTQPRFIVLTASTTPAVNCWGKYQRVALVELDGTLPEGARPKMISERARGIARIHRTWENLNVGSTARCAFRRALSEAQELCSVLNQSAT